MAKVLIICADQMRGDCLSCAGHPLARTPYLDSLAAEGALFLRHYTPSAPCGPARATMLTGLYPFNHRSIANGSPLHRRHTNLAREVKKAGVAPLLFGYTDTTPDPALLPARAPDLRSYQNTMDGFFPMTRWSDDICENWIMHLARRGYAIPEKREDIYLPQNAAEWPRSPSLFSAEDSDAAYLTDLLADYLRAGEKDNWLIFHGSMRPHPPFVAPAPYNEMYTEGPPPAKLATVAEEAARHPYLAHALKEMQKNKWFRAGKGGALRDASESEINAVRCVYWGLVSEVDAQVGRLIDALKTLGHWDDTLVIFTSDHGEMLGEHFCWGKGGWFDSSYHIPLIIRDPRPGAKLGTRINHFTESVDLLPTVLEWLGVDSPRQLDGMSVLPLARGESDSPLREGVFVEYDFRNVRDFTFEKALGIAPSECALNIFRGERWKYAHFNALPPLLFDMREDPDEFNNLAETNKKEAARGMREILNLRMRHAERDYADTLCGKPGRSDYCGRRRS